MIDQYMLDENGQPTPAPDLMMWAKWMGTANRTLACTEVKGRCVSTVFIGLDHRFGAGEPVLWETMVFEADDRTWGYMRRYTSREDALRGHDEVCALAAAGGDPEGEE